VVVLVGGQLLLPVLGGIGLKVVVLLLLVEMVMVVGGRWLRLGLVGRGLLVVVVKHLCGTIATASARSRQALLVVVSVVGRKKVANYGNLLVLLLVGGAVQLMILLLVGGRLLRIALVGGMHVGDMCVVDHVSV
jgi:hypothetical protein